VNKFFRFLTLLILLIIGVSRCTTRENVEREKKKYREEQEFRMFVDNLDYSNPVRYYKNPNDVFRDIDSNKYRFKQLVNGKMIQVKGIINEGFIEDKYFAIQEGDYADNFLNPKVYCYPQKKDIANMINLSSGQTVEIAGIVSLGESIYNTVSLKYCKFTIIGKKGGSNNLNDLMKLFNN